jgi:protein-tyrosine phosphatase
MSSSWVNDREASLIVPGIYVSNRQTATNAPYVAKELGVTCIVSLSLNVKTDRDHANYKATGCTVELLECGIDDTPQTPLLEAADCAVTHAHQVITGGGIILFHCDQGISRSPAAMILYLIKYHALPLYTARSIVCAARPQAQPNRGFLQQLARWDWRQDPTLVAWLKANNSTWEALDARRKALCSAIWQIPATAACQCSFCLAASLC